MPILVGAAEVGAGPGFMLPIFKQHPGGNSDFVQRIAADDLIDGFDDILPEAPILFLPAQERLVGQPALWVFRATEGEIFVGDQVELTEYAVQLVSAGPPPFSDGTFLLALADLVLFCGLAERYPQVLRTAYESLAQDSKTSADAWRDGVVLLSAARYDIARSFMDTDGARRQLGHVCVVAEGEACRVYGPAALKVPDEALSTVRSRGKVFGVHEVSFRALKPVQRRAQSLPAKWVIASVGGVARRALQQSALRSGILRVTSFPESFELVVGRAQEGDFAEPPAQLIAICGSGHSQVTTLREAIRALEGGRIELDGVATPIRPKTSHIVNIRPIGFGTPRLDRLELESLRDTFPHADVIWNVANHRLRRPLQRAGGLVAGGVAAKVTRMLSMALLTHGKELANEGFFRPPSNDRIFGLAGFARLEPGWSLQALIERALYSMLNTDVSLVSARRVVAYFPSPVGADGFAIPVGRHTLNVNVRTSPVGRRDLLVLATGARAYSQSRGDFQEFVAALVSGYGWRLRHDEPDMLLFEDQGEFLEVQVAGGDDRIIELISTKCDRGSVVIITDRTVTSATRRLAEIQDWALIHYSDLAEWMQGTYELGLHEGLLDFDDDEAPTGLP